MTKSTITKERLEKIVSDPMINQGSEFAMMARMALAAMDSEPVIWNNGCNKSVPAALRYLAENQRPIGGESSFNTAHLYQLAREIELMAEAPLYRHAQPAPETECEPIAWLNDAYLARGVVDGEAGSEDAGPGCIPVYREASPAQPAPVVPDEMLCEFYEVANWPDLVRELVKHVEQLQDSAKRNVKPWEDTFPETLLPAYIDRIKQADEACRAAMLAASRQSLGSEPATMPGKWIPVSERMPEKNQNVLISVNFDSDLVEPLICSARYTGSTFRRGDVTVKPGTGIEEVTHWMPLPAAPQEVQGE